MLSPEKKEKGFYLHTETDQPFLVLPILTFMPFLRILLQYALAVVLFLQ